MSAETIWRFALPITDRPTVKMPVGAAVLSVGPPRGSADELDLWVTVDPAETMREHCQFLVVGTGHPLPDDAARFVGTVVTHGGTLVWHVFLARSNRGAA